MAYSDAQRVKYDEEHRVETGAVRFGDDWNGLFVRGDDCIQIKFILEKMLGDSLCLFLLHPMEASYIKMILEIINDDVLMPPPAGAQKE